MKKIIIPTDFSENAFNALKYSCSLFKDDRCKFYLLHTYEEEVFDTIGPLTDDIVEERKEIARKKAAHELERTTAQIIDLYKNQKHNFIAISAFGLLIDEVNDLAEQEDADLIVTSTRGRTNDRKLTFGSNTLQIIKYVQCPVLSIPEKFQFSHPRRILFPSNYLLPYQARELKLVSGIATSFSAEIDMLYVSKIKQETYRQKVNKKKIMEEFQEVKVEFHREEQLEKTEAIQSMIAEKNIELLILVNSRHSYLENVLYTSTIDKIGLNPKIPFLVLQNFPRF